MNKGGTVQHIELPSTFESLSEIENFIDVICEQNKFGEGSYGNILIALTEAVNNAITHGNKLNPDKTINLNIKTTTREIEFTIKDEGSGFDHTKIPDPTLPENLEKLNGRGVFLMHSLADHVAFEDNGAKIRLKFSISNN